MMSKTLVIFAIVGIAVVALVLLTGGTSSTPDVQNHLAKLQAQVTKLQAERDARGATFLPVNNFLSIPQPYAPLGADGKLAIPPEIKQLRVDIGLSFSAPISAEWLRRHPDDRMVYGFEPHLGSFVRILSDDRSVKSWFMDRHQFGKHFFMFNCAMDEKAGYLPFYWTKGDPGTSSLNTPNGSPGFEIAMRTNVPAMVLQDFLAFVPWDRFPYIEFVKVDAQGADFRIVKGIGPYLDRIVFLAAEKSAPGYSSTHSEGDLRSYLQARGWEVVDGNAESGASVTFGNTKHRDKWASLDSWLPPQF